MNTLRERLQYVINLRKIKQTDLARLANVSQSNIACILNGRNKSTNPEALGRMAAVLGVSLAWLAGVSSENFPKFSEDEEDSVNILYYEFKDGDLITLSHGKSYSLKYLKEHNATAENCKLFKVNNDAMEPLLYIGDTILVNCLDNEPWAHTKAHVYLFLFNKQSYIRKIITSFSSLQISALNTQYPPQTIQLDEFKKNFKVVGRVIDKFGNGGL